MDRKPSAQPGPPPGSKPPKVSTGSPIAPTELPKGWSAAALGMRDPKAGPRCAIHPSEGGYQPPVTPGGGYGLRLTPKCLRIMIAIGQPSTDSVGAHGVVPMSLRTTLMRSRYPAVQDHRVLRRQDGVTRHPSRSQRRPKTAHAVLKNSAHDWRSSGHETKVKVVALLLQGWGPHLLESMRLKFSDPTRQPHRPPKETVRPLYSAVLAPQRQRSRVLEAGIQGLHLDKMFESTLWCPGRRPPQGNARAVRTWWPLSGTPPGQAPN